MKNIITIFFALFLGFNAIAFANIYSIDQTIELNKNSLCKTWYVTKAFETEGGKETNDRTDKALGSTFVFNLDNSFSLTDNSKKNAKPTLGTWKETGENSISITMQDVELKFDIQKLTKDSLYLIGDLENKKMHLVFSSNFVKPINYLEEEIESGTEKPTKTVRFPVSQQNKTKEAEQTAKTNEVVSEKEKTDNSSKLNPLRENVIEIWELSYISVVYKDEVETHKLPLNIDFSENNSFKITEDGIVSEGTWELKGEVILLTMYGKTTTFNITKSTKKEMVFSKFSPESSFNLHYIKKN